MLLVCNPAVAFGQVLAASLNPGPFILAYQRTDHHHVAVTADYKQEEPQTYNNLHHQLLYKALLIFSCSRHSLFGYCGLPLTATAAALSLFSLSRICSTMRLLVGRSGPAINTSIFSGVICCVPLNHCRLEIVGRRG
jgi:hypothetical protein